MEYWSIGALRQVRIAPAQRIGDAEGAKENPFLNMTFFSIRVNNVNSRCPLLALISCANGPSRSVALSALASLGRLFLGLAKPHPRLYSFQRFAPHLLLFAIAICYPGSAGRLIRNVAPEPLFGSAHNRPPCSSIIERLMASPMPKPSGLVV